MGGFALRQFDPYTDASSVMASTAQVLFFFSFHLSTFSAIASFLINARRYEQAS